MRRTLTVLLALTALAAAPIYAEIAVLDIVPNTTRMVARLHLREIRDTPLFAALKKQHRQLHTLFAGSIAQFAGIDVDAVDTVWMLSEQAETGALVLEGTFVPDMIRAKLESAPGVSVLDAENCLFLARYRQEKEELVRVLALVDKNTVVAGDEKSVLTLIGVLSGVTPALSASTPALQALAVNTHQLAAVMRGDLAGWNGFDRNLASVVQQVWVNADVENNLTADLILVTETDKQARAAEFILRGIIMIVTSKEDSETDTPLLKRTLETALIRQTGNRVTCTLRVPGTDILKRFAPTQREKPPSEE